MPKLDVNDTLPILEWAKYSSNAAEFLKKSKTKGFTSETKIRRLEIFRNQLNLANKGIEVTDEDLWKFLRIFQIVPYDLDSKNSTVVTLLCSLIETSSSQPPSLVFSRIVTYIQEFNQNAGTLEIKNVSKEINFLFDRNATRNINQDINILKERGDYILQGINNTIAGSHIVRASYLTELYEKVKDYDFLFVTGSRGSGKSVIVKDFILSRNSDVPVFYLRSEDLDKNHLNDVFSSIGMNHSIGQLEGYFSLLPGKILVIESLEKILELNLDNAFVDLLQFIRKQSGWTVIATGRDYAYQQIIFSYLQPRGINYESININGFNDDQVEELCSEIPALKGFF
ncbi:hypothetical protein [Photorhabdus temperata]|uniref:Uncharacterized protein n=1 Tax=Photorhabdus temperata J3 TaxID=1389415 RepID=U7QYX5_PHOTE|nr:hypothetical protein [Photorhabdus temperata]ERT12285.1 hypothetical protein O185_14930 [Photorhabdus temperata J3]